jgi:hypothetical protein
VGTFRRADEASRLDRDEERKEEHEGRYGDPQQPASRDLLPGQGDGGGQEACRCREKRDRRGGLVDAAGDGGFARQVRGRQREHGGRRRIKQKDVAGDAQDPVVLRGQGEADTRKRRTQPEQCHREHPPEPTPSVVADGLGNRVHFVSYEMFQEEKYGEERRGRSRCGPDPSVQKAPRSWASACLPDADAGWAARTPRRGIRRLLKTCPAISHVRPGPFAKST